MEYDEPVCVRVCVTVCVPLADGVRMAVDRVCSTSENVFLLRNVCQMQFNTLSSSVLFESFVLKIEQAREGER